MRTLKGTVVSANMQKTVVVRVDRQKQHPQYGKYERLSKKFKAHDEKSEYRAGDIIMMEETRPLSKEKRWKVIELIKRTEVEVEKDAADE